jgi:hypothetical protein
VPRPLRDRGTLHNEGVIFAMHFQYRSALPRAAIVALLLYVLALPLASTAAAQGYRGEFVQCVVGWSGPEIGVVVVSSTNTSTNIREVGAACTTMIANGLWYGLNKYLDWSTRGTGYHWMCRVDFGLAETMDVYSGWDYWSDFVGRTTCAGLGPWGSIRWYPY